jgi:hypothetical protein
MNAILKIGLDYLAKKFREPSSWIPITGAVCAYLHYNVPPEVQGYVDTAAASIISALFIALTERHGANPLNAPLPDDSVVQPTSGASQPSVPVSAGSDDQGNPRVLDDGTPYHPPVRPGFDRRN